jgi:hypothetical protein
MADKLLLHVGLMKSGTTFIQGRLDANRELLAEQGILFPGPGWGRQARAVSDFLRRDGGTGEVWGRMREEIRAHPGPSIISMEYLGPMPRPRIQAMLQDFPDTEVRVVLTVRDLGRCVPAMWQETLKNGRRWTWSEFLHDVEHYDHDAARGRRAQNGGETFWRQQSMGRITQRWAGTAGADRVTVVTVPPRGAPSSLLWDRFAGTAGIEPRDWAQAPRANESLGAASTLMMRRLNDELTDLSVRKYKRTAKALAKHTLGKRRAEEDPIGFTVPAWLRARWAAERELLVESRVHIVGDLAELEPVDTAGVDPDAVAVDDELAAAVGALAELLREGDAALNRPNPASDTTK